MESSISCEEDLWGIVPQLPVTITPAQCSDQIGGCQAIRHWGIDLYRIATALACLCLIGGGAYALLAPDELYWRRAFSFVFLGVLPAAAIFALGWVLLRFFEWIGLIFPPLVRVCAIVLRPLTIFGTLSTRYALIFMKEIVVLLRTNACVAIKYSVKMSIWLRHAPTCAAMLFYYFRLLATFPVRLAARMLLWFARDRRRHGGHIVSRLAAQPNEPTVVTSVSFVPGRAQAEDSAEPSSAGSPIRIGGAEVV